MEISEMKKPTEICLEIKKETPGAYLVTDGTTVPEFIPKSQVHLEEDGGPGDTVNFTMPEWLATRKGFI